MYLNKLCIVSDDETSEDLAKQRDDDLSEGF